MSASSEFDHDSFEANLRQQSPLLWFTTLVGPFLLAAGILTAVYLTYGPVYVTRLVFSGVLGFFFFGRFIILGGHGEGLASETLFAMVLFMDLAVASILAFHVTFLFKLPLIGPKFQELMEDGQVIMHSNPWMKRATFAAIIVLVTFPLAATGSIGGSIFGRLLGMTRVMTFCGVAIGSVVGCGAMYFGSQILNHWGINRDHPAFFWGGVIAVVLIILVLNHRYRQYIKRHRQEKAQQSEKAASQPAPEERG